MEKHIWTREGRMQIQIKLQEKITNCKNNWKVGQIAQRSCGIPHTGDSQGEAGVASTWDCSGIVNPLSLQHLD